MHHGHTEILEGSATGYDHGYRRVDLEIAEGDTFYLPGTTKYVGRATGPVKATGWIHASGWQIEYEGAWHRESKKPA